MPQLRTYDHDEFPVALKWQALSFMRVEWPFIFAGDLRFATDIYWPELAPTHFAVTHSDLLLSYAAVIRTRLDHAGQTYGVAGLGNVFTFPPYRREGFGSQVVVAATRHIEAGNADVAALFCAADHAGFYERRGWVALSGATTLVGPKADPSPYDVLRMMLFVSDRGKAGRLAFESQPWYVGDPW